jgi:hypothetical protein
VVESAPPARPPAPNPDVANVRAAHLLPNLAALRALDLNENNNSSSQTGSETSLSSSLSTSLSSSAPPQPPASTSSAASPAPTTTATTQPPPSFSRSNSQQHHPESPKPSLFRSLFDNEESLPKYKRDLVAKMKVLRSELTSLQPQSGHCRLEVSRQEIFEDSYRQASFCASTGTVYSVFSVK